MTIEEAVKNLEKEAKCRNEDVSKQMFLNRNVEKVKVAVRTL